MVENQPSEQNEQNLEPPSVTKPERSWSILWKHEDYWAIWIGFSLLLVLLFSLIPQLMNTEAQQEYTAEIIQLKNKAKTLRTRVSEATNADEKAKLLVENEAVRKQIKSLQSKVYVHPLKSWLSKPKSWGDDPRESFGVNKKGNVIIGYSYLEVPKIVCVGIVFLLLFMLAIHLMGEKVSGFAAAFSVLFLITIIAMMLSSQKVIKAFNLEYPLWAILAGGIISNTLGTPRFLKPAIKTELYIKTGLVLMGSTVLLSKLLALSFPGVMTAWVVTPVVLISTYWFGQKVLKIESKALNMTICADMSVCGVSAAIATGAACKAKRDEISLAIALSLSFTVIMMIVLPWVITQVGMSDVLGGAWIGGTIDATGAVAAAGAFLGPDGELVAITIKMIQNILIGIVAFGVAVYWVAAVEKGETDQKPSLWEIWYRFPKFILGFAAASILFSLLTQYLPEGELAVSSITSISKTLRTWLFCLAFVCIGLEANFAELAKPLKSGKPLILYVCGQTLNLILTLFVAWLMFEVFFPDILTRVS